MEIKSLIERIEKSEGADRELDHAIYEALGKPVVRMASASTHGTDLVNWAPFYSASLDAAVTLVPEGWSFEVRSSGTGDPGQASVWNPMRAPGHEEYRVSNFATPALALCAAALKARNPSHEG